FAIVRHKAVHPLAQAGPARGGRNFPSIAAVAQTRHLVSTRRNVASQVRLTQPRPAPARRTSLIASAASDANRALRPGDDRVHSASNGLHRVSQANRVTRAIRPMYLNAIGTALPERRYTKSDCWDAFAASDWFERLDARSRAIAKIVLTRNNGIEARRRCGPDGAATRDARTTGDRCGHRQHVHGLPVSGPDRVCDRTPWAASGYSRIRPGRPGMRWSASQLAGRQRLVGVEQMRARTLDLRGSLQRSDVLGQ